MIEKLNKVFEKLPPEHRDIMREAFTILIEEVINAHFYASGGFAPLKSPQKSIIS